MTALPDTLYTNIYTRHDRNVTDDIPFAAPLTPSVSLMPPEGEFTLAGMTLSRRGVVDTGGLTLRPQDVALFAEATGDWIDTWRWVMGDLLVSGEYTYGDLMEQGKPIFKWTIGTWRNIASVCRAFPIERRVYVPPLTIWYYSEARAIDDPAAQDNLLERAIDAQMSVQDFRAAVKAWREDNGEDVPAIQRRVMVYPGDLEATAAKLADELPPHDIVRLADLLRGYAPEEVAA